jgi:glycosyltransferase involved in cell wall biosynthesis
MGTRGVPAAYGGFETFAEQLGARLVERGHAVTVYGRSHNVPVGLREHRGMRLRVLPTIRHKYLDTVVHTGLSVLDGLLRRFDIVLICNNANAPLALVPRLGGAKVVLNVDGLEWERGKWNRLGRWYYQACAWLAPKLPVVLVSDAQVIAHWYQQRYGKATAYIPYGSDVQRTPPGETLARLGLQQERYILFVSRLEPENHAHTVIDAYRRAGGLSALDVPLVVVGDAPYATTYKIGLEADAAANPGTILTGYVFGDGYAELQSNALIYVQATEVGGTHPALVEAMGRGATIIANDVPEHREVLGDSGRYYGRNDPESLARELVALSGDASERHRLGAAAAARARAAFSWDHVTGQYEALFRGIGRRRRDGLDRAVASEVAGRPASPASGTQVSDHLKARSTTQAGGDE